MVEVQPSNHVVIACVELVPNEGMLDDRTTVLQQGVAVRVCPSIELGELDFPRAKAPSVGMSTRIWRCGATSKVNHRSEARDRARNRGRHRLATLDRSMAAPTFDVGICLVLFDADAGTVRRR